MKFFITCVLWVSTLFVALVVTDKVKFSVEDFKKDSISTIDGVLESFKKEIARLKGDAPAIAGDAGEEFSSGIARGLDPSDKIKETAKKVEREIKSLGRKIDPSKPAKRLAKKAEKEIKSLGRKIDPSKPAKRVAKSIKKRLKKIF